MPLPSHLTLEIVTPDRAVIHEKVDAVVIPAADGSLGVLPGHTPLLTTLRVGLLRYRKGEEQQFTLIAFGFAEVLPDRVTILAQVAERPEEIDAARADAARMRAETRLAKPARDIDFERARIALMKSLVRLQVATKRRVRR